MHFLKVAYETGLIETIDWQLFESACRIMAGSGDNTFLTINVSALHLRHEDFDERLLAMLARSGFAPERLIIEVTEGSLLDDPTAVHATLERLRAFGVGAALDDFGTGYSSLSYLKRLPIDTLKIDKEFVGDLTTDPGDEAITATVITMAHSLGLNVVAEGVERAEQVEYLREQDCDEIQGHWLAFPLPPDQCLAFLIERAQQRRVVLGEPQA